MEIFYGSQGAITPWLSTIFGKSKNHHTNQKKQKQNQQIYNKIRGNDTRFHLGGCISVKNLILFKEELGAFFSHMFILTPPLISPRYRFFLRT